MRTQISRWLPALIIMLVIFLFSSQPSSNLPNFNWADKIVKKGGHMIGYALLALSYWRAFDLRKERRWLAWLLAVLYAATDEFHQIYSKGRHPSFIDIFVFDNLGALISLWLTDLYLRRKRSNAIDPVVEEMKHKHR